VVVRRPALTYLRTTSRPLPPGGGQEGVSAFVVSLPHHSLSVVFSVSMDELMYPCDLCSNDNDARKRIS
jgi:hypothetical protein